MAIKVKHEGKVTSRIVASAFCILHSAFCICLASPVPVRFNADAAAPQAFQAAAYHGETLDIEARLTLRGAPLGVADGASATMHWQTNGMGAAWWTAPASVTTSGLVRATWTPSMDCGADAYRIFLGVADGGSNLSYRANMLLRMVGSPGETPNALPLPTPFIDFAKVAWTNAPWGEGGGGTDGGAVTNIVEGIVADATNGVLRVDQYGNLELEGDINAGSASFESVYVGGYGGPTLAIYNDDGIQVYTREMPSEGDTYLYFPSDTWGTLAVREDLAPYATRAWTLSTYGGTNAWMAIDGDLLGIYSCTNAAAGTNTLWESSSAMGGQLANVAQRATNNTARITALEARPDLTSWGDYAPDGTPNPDAEAMVYLNKALTLMGSGFSWATSGSYACLCQSGAVAFQVENAGEIRIGTDVTTNYFGLVQGGSVTVGCRTDGIVVADGIAYLTYAYAGGAFPAVWFCGDLAEGVWQETSPSWIDNGDGTATAAVPATGSRGFWKATSTRETGAYFRSNVPAHFPAGVYGALSAEPVKYDSVITVQSGGHTYRIPAEFIQ